MCGTVYDVQGGAVTLVLVGIQGKSVDRTSLSESFVNFYPLKNARFPYRPSAKLIALTPCFCDHIKLSLSRLELCRFPNQGIVNCDSFCLFPK